MQDTHSPRHILVAPAWPYANGSLHLGHIASLVGADVLARYHRLKGDRVLMVSGSDCYGTPIAVEAARRGVSPASIAEQYHSEFESTLIDGLNFSYDLYTKTTTPQHTRVVQDVFSRLYEDEHIYTKTEQALYSPFLKRHLPDRFVEGGCPHCGYGDARGDQCDECGKLTDPLALKNPRVNKRIVPSTISPDDVVLEVRDTEQFFLRLSSFQEMLEEWAKTSSNNWRVNAAQITKSFLKQGLQDRAITRDTDWGIPVPVAGYEEKKIYVWFEAVLGYFSASQQCLTDRGEDDLWKEWWKQDDALHYYVHGKDNVPFHTVILPAILKGYDNLHFPDVVLSSEYLSLEGKQFSTSRLYAVWVSDFLADFDADILRYFLLAHGPESGDIDFRWSEFAEMVNGELIGTFGNLVHRVCSFALREFPDGVSVSGDIDGAANDLLSTTEKAFSIVGDHIGRGEFRRAFREVLRVAEEGNRYAHDKEPWKTIADNPSQAQADLAVLLHSIRNLATLVQPFLPRTSKNIQSFFGSASIDSGVGKGEGCVWYYEQFSPKNPIVLSAVEHLFTKISDKDVQKQVQKLDEGL